MITVRLQMVCFMLCLLFSGQAQAEDRVLLKLQDGSVVEGTIIEKDRSFIVIETELHNIKYERRILMKKIAEIEKIEVQNSNLEGTEPQGDADDVDLSNKSNSEDWVSPTRYIVVPIHGRIGMNSLDDEQDTVISSAVNDVLRYARRKKITHVVFSIDTPGGSVAEVNEIVRLMESNSKHFVYHAYIIRSISAGMDVVYSCDHIWFSPGPGVAGGALRYTQLPTGVVEYDDKLNSISAAQLSSLAESNGHNPHIAAAMVHPEKELYLRRQSEDVFRVAGTPGNESEVVQIDGPETILTLTKSKAVRFGMGDILDKGMSQIGAKIGIDKWARYGGNYGANKISRAIADIQRDEKKRRGLAKRIVNDLSSLQNQISKVSSLVTDAKRLNPENYNYAHNNIWVPSIDAWVKEFTPESKRAWLRNTSKAIAAWRSIINRIKEISKRGLRVRAKADVHAGKEPYKSFAHIFESEAERIAQMWHIVKSHDRELSTILGRARDEISRLHDSRHKSSR